MKTLLAAGLIVVFLTGTLLGLPGGQDKPASKSTPAKAKPEAASALPTEQAPAAKADFQPKPSQYDSGNRRDPFRDLLGGSTARERVSAEGPDLFLEELRLIGIVKQKGRVYALVAGPQGFHFKIKEGDKFSDGFVLKITQDGVTFRQTSEKGMRLISPRDIVKDINPEER